MNNLEDLRLKTQTPPPRDKVKLWHEQMLGINNRINAPLPPVPPQSNTISESPSQSPNPQLVLQPASESMNQSFRPIIAPSAPASEFSKLSNPFIHPNHNIETPIPTYNVPPAPQHASPPQNDDDASSMGTERPASALERANGNNSDFDFNESPQHDHEVYQEHHPDYYQEHYQPIIDRAYEEHIQNPIPTPIENPITNPHDIPLPASSPTKSTDTQSINKASANFAVNDKDLRELLMVATDNRLDKAVRDALKRAARERIEVLKKLENERKVNEMQQEENNQSVPPWAKSMYDLLQQTHERLEALNIKSPEGSRVGSPSPLPNNEGINLQSIHHHTFSMDDIPKAAFTSQPMVKNNPVPLIPQVDYEPHQAPYQDPYPMIPPSHYSPSKKSESTVLALPQSTPLGESSNEEEPALPAASPPGQENEDTHDDEHEHLIIHEHPAHDGQPGATHIIHEYVPSPPQPVAPTSTPAFEYKENENPMGIVADELKSNISQTQASVSPYKVPLPQSEIAESPSHHSLNNSLNRGMMSPPIHHEHPVAQSVDQPALTPYANHPWENIKERLNAWSDIWSSKISPNELDVAKESTHVGKYVSMIACDTFCTQVYKRWVRTLGGRYPPVQIDKIYLPPSFSDVLNMSVASDINADTASTFRSFWHDLGFTGTPKYLLALALYRTDKYHFQILKFDLEQGILTHYDPFDAPALSDPRPKLWWRGLRVAFPEIRIPAEEKLIERTVAINRPKPNDRSDCPLAALACWRHMLVNKKADKETDLFAVRTLIAAEIEGVQKLTDRRNKQRAKKTLNERNNGI